MVDGRLFYSDDDWEMVWLVPEPGDKPRKVTGNTAYLARFLAIHTN